MATYQVPEQVLSRELDGEAVLLDLRSGHYFGLNSSAARMWTLVKEGVGREAIAAAITDEFAVSHDRALADIDQLIATLLDRGLLISANGKSA